MSGRVSAWYGPLTAAVLLKHHNEATSLQQGSLQEVPKHLHPIHSQPEHLQGYGPAFLDPTALGTLAGLLWVFWRNSIQAVLTVSAHLNISVRNMIML